MNLLKLCTIKRIYDAVFMQNYTYYHGDTFMNYDIFFNLFYSQKKLIGIFSVAVGEAQMVYLETSVPIKIKIPSS